MVRIIAFIIILTPGIAAAFGIKLMRDSLFAEFLPIFINVEIQFIIGLILFIAGIAFIGGFIIQRDKKRNIVKKKK